MCLEGEGEVGWLVCWRLGSGRYDIKEENNPEPPIRVSTTPREVSTGLDDFLNDNDDDEDDSEEYTDDSEEEDDDDDDE